ncbi:acyl-CoA dehydrogenase [Mycobacterium sp. MFM001]|uniref:acyl-CoA dehydrogenase family protein n=1 Tax=Mycobacterium sp. MFM001 TaxID=2049453 RepID=UPI000DA587D0|nr:acyl-CoA dehydrogenase family protein [Mycobacterium sp. MFM001]GBE64480.1 acyl-CoA dehydrogenase [Mycobacterium sp. MFM001]
MDRDDGDDLDFELLRTSAREFLAGRGEKDSVGDLAAMDWLGLLVSEERGGAGWRPVEACLIAEELGRAHDRSPWFGCAMAAAAFADAPDAVSGHWLADTLSGTTITGFAPGGNVVRIVGGDKVRAVITAGSDGLHLVELGESAARWLDCDALDTARPAWCVDLTGATRVPIGSAIQAERLNAVGRLLVSADALGAMSSALARLTSYLKGRTAFGAPIASFQAVQHRLVDLLVFEVKSRAIVAKAARTLGSADLGDGARLRAAIAQSAAAHAFVAAKATAAIDECIQLSGGIGFTWEYPLHHEMRRAATDAVLLGTARSSRALLAEASGW